jgi:hypothetical protein
MMHTHAWPSLKLPLLTYLQSRPRFLVTPQLLTRM